MDYDSSPGIRYYLQDSNGNWHTPDDSRVSLRDRYAAHVIIAEYEDGSFWYLKNNHVSLIDDGWRTRRPTNEEMMLVKLASTQKRPSSPR